MKIEKLPIVKLLTNSGQIKGLPKNPRFIRDERFEKLKKSLTDDPEMTDLRELIVFPLNGKFVVIAGNMRLRAAQDLGWKELPCKVLSEKTKPEKLRAYAVKDNVPFGENSWDDYANEWDETELEDWGLEMPGGFNPINKEKEIDDNSIDLANECPNCGYKW